MRQKLNLSLWNDSRNADTISWMITGLLQSKSSNLSQWISYVQSKATQASSTEIRFTRVLKNGRIKTEELYRPLILEALKNWGSNEIKLALDTSMLFDTYCMIRIVLLYRGRGVTIAWEVIEHGSASVDLKQLLNVLEATETILKKAGIQKVKIIADRGFLTPYTHLTGGVALLIPA